jgi:hypothetical protein
VKTVDRTFGWLLVLGGILHGIGSIVTLRQQPDVLVWALAGSLAALLVAALNLMRVSRPADRVLAWVSAAGTVAWMSVAIGFGLVIGNVLDPRVLYHTIAGVFLTVFSIRTILRASSLRGST